MSFLVLKRNPALGLICFLFSLNTSSQIIDTRAENADDYSFDFYQDINHNYKRIKNQAWARFKNSKTYDNQGVDHSEYLCLNPDSTFEFVGYYHSNNTFSFGKWTKLDRFTIILNSDAFKAFQFIRNKGVLKKYGIGYRGIFRIKDWSLTIKNDSLITNGFVKDKLKAIALIDSLSRQIDNQNLLIQVDTNNLYNPGGNIVGRSFDSSFFSNDYKILVKFVSIKKLFDSKKKNDISKDVYYFLPGRYYKSLHNSNHSNQVFSSALYFDDQKLIKAIGQEDAEDVHSAITSFKRYIVFGKPYKY
jgi:hypothetical protein